MREARASLSLSYCTQTARWVGFWHVDAAQMAGLGAAGRKPARARCRLGAPPDLKARLAGRTRRGRLPFRPVYPTSRR